jgi:hypothetical protein
LYGLTDIIQCQRQSSLLQQHCYKCNISKFYNSVNRVCVKDVKYIFIGLKKRLVWACLKGVTL